VISEKGIYTRAGARTGLVLIWVIALACAMTLHTSGATFQSHPSMWGVGAALGGAAGNLLDILRRRSVLDFIDLRCWPVFNVADVGIVAGLVVAFWPLT
jgi:lipoprotein signal peptidase